MNNARTLHKVLVIVLAFNVLIEGYSVIYYSTKAEFTEEANRCTREAPRQLDNDGYDKYMSCVNTAWSFIPTNAACECLEQMKENK